eukprot:1975989-Rhodomonas_salina.1
MDCRRQPTHMRTVASKPVHTCFSESLPAVLFTIGDSDGAFRPVSRLSDGFSCETSGSSTQRSSLRRRATWAWP